MNMSEFEVRQLVTDDWSGFRLIRLESLAKYPQFFAPSQDERNFTPEQWMAFLENKNAAIFGLFDSADLVGVSGIIRENNNPESHRALMMASYIREEYRGKSLSRLFYDARIAWARKQKDIDTLLIYHREGNLISRNANQRFGFKQVGSFKKTYLDGTEGLSLAYELKL